MADKKISELTNITGANLADADEFVVVDTSANETKAITYAELKSGLDTSTGFVRVTGDTMTGNLSFGDNNKAIFGAGSDLQIYHTGSASRIQDVGTGNLYIAGTNLQLTDGTVTRNYFQAVDGGAATVYYNGAAKLSTTSTGVDVTGTVTADGLTVDGNIATQGLNPFIRLIETDQTDKNAYIRTYDGVFNIGTENTAQTVRTQRLRIDHSTGDISFYEDTGTTPKLFWDASAEALELGSPIYESGAFTVKDDITFPNATNSNADAWNNTGKSHIKLEGGNNALAVGVNFTGNSRQAWLQAGHASPVYADAVDTSMLLLQPLGGKVGIGTSLPRTKLDIEGSFALDGDSATLATTTQTAIATYSASSFKGGKVIITANDGTDTYITELLIANTASTATATEYGQVGTGTFAVAYDVDVSGGNVRILATAPNSTSTTFKVAKNLM